MMNNLSQMIKPSDYTEVLKFKLYDHIDLSQEGRRFGDTALLFFSHAEGKHGAHITNMPLQNCLPEGREFLITSIRWRYIPNDVNMRPTVIRARALEFARGGVMHLDIISKRYYTDTLNETLLNPPLFEAALTIQSNVCFGVRFEWRWADKSDIFMDGSIRVELRGYGSRPVC